VIEQSLSLDTWQSIDDQTRYERVDLCHYGMEQRWLVVYSESAYQRAGKTLARAQGREWEKVNKQLFHLQAQRFDSAEAAGDALDKIAKKLSYHKIETTELTQHIQYASRGRPKADSAIKVIKWQITATVAPDTTRVSHRQQQKACYVLGTNIPVSQLSDLEVISGYKTQGAVERGFRFLKSPVFFVSSLYVKKPSRIEGLLMVMTLALLIYSVAQRRMRRQLESMDGITDLRKKILQLFGQRVCQIYQISSA